ncbi:putative adipose-regulatory protein-domain-containing protein [Tricladium varicosporioides]|nr:putative adipose-regulatory protein-domain-containing protein [Hymenoscyphus varicosporioides]
MDIVLRPFRIATSKPAQKTYLNAILFTITTTILLGLAIVAYGLFYYNYVPQINIERTIHLQYGHGPHPYGIISLGSSLISQQSYDICLDLHVPRSPTNLETGNFMLSLSLLAKNYKLASNPPTTTTVTPPTRSSLVPAAIEIAAEDILFSSRRPALLTYTSRLVSLSERIFQLPLYILGLRREDETLTIPMAESASFPRGLKNIPAFAMLELQAGQNLQVYDVKIRFTARFGGLRWWMWNHRLISALVGVGVFWGAEVAGCGIAWVVLMGVIGRKSDSETEITKGEETDGTTTIKDEPRTDDSDLSDTPRTFPTYGRQPPLRFEPKIKHEPDSEEFAIDEATIQPLAAEADDEDDSEGGFRGVILGADRGNDSGLGTSFSERGEGSGVTRRKSKGRRS